MPSDSRSQTNDLDEWLKKELRFATSAMLKSISATHLTRERNVFAQSVTPARGSVVASPEFGDYDPEPDYFFHWLRDSALVMDALREAMLAGLIGEEAHMHFADFIRFSLSLSDPSATRPKLDRASVDPHYRQYLRPESELDDLTPDRLRAEARFNPDGTLDFLKWNRPQHDGPALRAIALMRYWPICPAGDGETRRLLEQLIRQDLDFVANHAHAYSYDLWEDELGEHYYTRLVQLGALTHGSHWIKSVDDSSNADRLRKLIDDLAAELDRHWYAAEGIYRSGGLPAMSEALIAPIETPASQEGSAQQEDRNPDIAVILGVLHAELAAGAHSIFDPKVQATLAKLENVFAARLAINRSSDKAHAPALGRYPGDAYFGGGAWYLATLAAAEFYFRLATATASGAFLARGDKFLRAIRRFTPPSGELSEQIDRGTGEQISAKNLAWSYAAFITACRARARARLQLISSRSA